MTSKSREKSPRHTTKYTFIPPKLKVNKINLDTISVVFLPGINTKVNKIKNSRPKPVPEVAVGIAYTHQQSVIRYIDKVELNRVSEKRSGGTNIYSAIELKTIAKNIGLEDPPSHKKDLAPLVRKRVVQSRSERGVIV
jgi:hypothetical protein